MIALTIFVAAAGSAAFLIAGYLFGAKRGLAARAALLSEGERSRQALRDADVRLARMSEIAQRPLVEPARPPDENVLELRAELRSLASAVMDRERSQDALKTEIKTQLDSLSRSAPDPDSLRREIQRLVSPLLTRENETKGLRDMMRELVGPMLEKQRFGNELSQLDASAGNLGALPRLLDSIAEKGSFETVVLSDEMGLPLAASSNAEEVDLLAGVAAMLLTVGDRVVTSGGASPMSIVMHDEANKNTVHRIFNVAGVRYMLTAVTRGRYITPEALDPVLAKLGRVLTRQEVAA